MRKIFENFVLVLLAGYFLSGCALIDFNQQLGEKMIVGVTGGVSSDERFTVSWEAQSLYEQKKDTFSAEEWQKGPCLGRINDEWVADVVHRPRTEVDDDMNNQCQEYYLHEQIKHYVLVADDGTIVQTK
ncbi:MAG TPA: hypothetical protein PLZ62_01490 [bacterium]|nr:hypothetical protein [bacterium]